MQWLRKCGEQEGRRAGRDQGINLPTERGISRRVARIVFLAGWSVRKVARTDMVHVFL